MMVRHAEARRREAALNATNFLREEFPEATPATLALALLLGSLFRVGRRRAAAPPAAPADATLL